ncbi:unnamed protein product [Aureobasidium uvarum]|uniref:MFS general substrate transporter n=1 Tax=Aureobasidium uvarum TaxID=2773716 RepID=A0A9N8KGX7_9PEZI|nr:unnamed protein product [Aureobasidium uvarum]
MIENVGKPERIMDIYRSYEPEHAAQAERQLARLYGLQKDTKVNGAVYQTAISIFSAGYIFMQLPSTLLMTKLRPSIFLKIIAQGRLAADAGSDDVLGEESISIWTGIAWAAKDYRVWLFAGLQMATTASISYSHFFPTLIQQIGIKNRTTVLLLTSPPYLVAFCWALGLAWMADKHQTRSIPASISCIVSMIGTVLLVALPHLYWARYAFTFLVCIGTFGIYSTTYTWLSSTIPRPPIKRAAAIGIANTLANLASLFANYFWLDEYGPTFQVSWGILLAFQAFAMGCILTLRFMLQRKNRKFERLAREINLNHESAVQALEEDAQRALKNNFRYVT